MRQRQELAVLVDRHAAEGPCRTAIANLDLYRGSATATPVEAIDDPSWGVPALCIVVQGRKRASIGCGQVVFEAADWMIAAIELPILDAVFETVDDEPFLGLRLRLDPALLSELLLEMPSGLVGPAPVATAPIEKLSTELEGVLVRLLRLLDDANDVAILARPLEREVCYRLLRGPQGGLLRQIANPDSRLSQVKLAIDWIRTHYTECLPIQTVASIARMGPSSFHQHFKVVTSMSPLQFQKQLRLAEARRLIRANHCDAATAAFKVGYQSASQFNRDYKKRFGEPPARDAAHALRGFDLSPPPPTVPPVRSFAPSTPRSRAGHRFGDIKAPLHSASALRR